jgi:ubiquitin carboxyl-terminal hydrolase 7
VPKALLVRSTNVNLQLRSKKLDRFEDARDYYDFLHNKKHVKFVPHPTKCDAAKYPAFELVLNSKIGYDTLAERVGAHINEPPTHIRFWTVNAASGNPKTTVKRGLGQNLQSILSPTGYSQLNSSQRSDAFYFDVLEISLAELDTKKSIRVTYLSEGITKEVSLRKSSNLQIRTDGFFSGSVRPSCAQEWSGRGLNSGSGEESSDSR